jgi:hypothetical protein
MPKAGCFPQISHTAAMTTCHLTGDNVRLRTFRDDDSWREPVRAEAPEITIL